MLLRAVPLNKVQRARITPPDIDRVAEPAARSRVSARNDKAQYSLRRLAKGLRVGDYRRRAPGYGTRDFHPPETALVPNRCPWLRARSQFLNREYAVAVASIADPWKMFLIHWPIRLNRCAVCESAIRQDKIFPALAACQTRKHRLTSIRAIGTSVRFERATTHHAGALSSRASTASPDQPGAPFLLG